VYQGTKQPAAVRRNERAGPGIDRPIFLVGAGRSGSTVFHSMFCEHPHVAWQSPLCNLFPAHPGLNRALLRTAHWPLLGRFLTRYLRPGERYAYWEHYCHGFARPCRDLLAADVTPLHRWILPPALARLVTPRRSRLLIKVTGWPRVGFLRELFPDAKFIHVYRDGRAVAGSLLAVGFWRGWGGPAEWGFGALDPARQAEWERHGKSFVALAGIQWKLLMEAMDRAAENVPASNFLRVRYEDFIADPVASFRRVVAFCELDWPARFEHSVRQRRLKTANDKWRETLTPEQQRILEVVLANSLRRYGYPMRP
jgi:hypothetical protein